MSDVPRLTEVLHHSPAAAQVRPVLADYSRVANEGTQQGASYAAHVNRFYELVTDFYEYGWGQSFHFASRFRGETLREAIARSEHAMALRLGLRPGMRVLDIGCGVGGPLRTIARFSGAEIVGINNNDYQVGRANSHIRAANLERLCSVQKGDFMAMPFEPESFDAAYCFESTCHAPSLEGVYAQIWRALKPGRLFASLEWCTTPRYDPGDPSHRRVRDAAVFGNGLVTLPGTDEALAAAQRAGFDVVESRDLAPADEVPWYEPLAPRGFSLASFRSSKLGRWCTSQALGALELVRVAPRGSRAVAMFLSGGADALVEAGEAGIITPAFLMVLRKPAT